MDIFVARQAIYDSNREIYAYELLYRNSTQNTFDMSINPESATYEVINNIMLVGLDMLTKGKIAFINCDAKVLGSEAITLLEKEKTVIEILETVEPTEEVLKDISKLNENGYVLALDDVVDIESIKELIPYSKYIKMDFLLTTKEERKNIVKALKSRDKILLAEKVENEEEFQEALSLGCSLFQGYYFSKPKIIKNKNLEMKSSLIFLLIDELSKENFDVKHIEKILKSDVGLMYRFMKFINSAYFGFVQEITNIGQAIMLVGEKQIRKWLLVVGFSEIYKGTNEDYTITSLIRAKFCEVIVREKYSQDNKDKQNEAFITGIFSDIHIVLGEDINIILKDLPVSKDIKAALKGEDNYLRMVLDLVLAYEKVEINTIELLSLVMEIKPEKLKDLYFEAIEWSNKLELH